MNVLIILSSSDPEIKWNSIRFGNFMLERGDDVTLFLNGPAADLGAGDSARFPIMEQAKIFALSEGVLVA